MLCSDSLPSLLERLESLLGLDKRDTCCVDVEFEGTCAPVSELYKNINIAIYHSHRKFVYIIMDIYLDIRTNGKACIF